MKYITWRDVGYIWLLVLLALAIKMSDLPKNQLVIMEGLFALVLSYWISSSITIILKKINKRDGL